MKKCADDPSTFAWNEGYHYDEGSVMSILALRLADRVAEERRCDTMNKQLGQVRWTCHHHYPSTTTKLGSWSSEPSELKGPGVCSLGGQSYSIAWWPWLRWRERKKRVLEKGREQEREWESLGEGEGEGDEGEKEMLEEACRKGLRDAEGLGDGEQGWGGASPPPPPPPPPPPLTWPHAQSFIFIYFFPMGMKFPVCPYLKGLWLLINRILQ